MDINILKDNEILIIAETEFERSFCTLLEGKIFDATVKRGLSPADIVGIKLTPRQEKKEKCQA